MKIKIRKGEKKDLKKVLELIKELADYEGSLKEVTLTVRELERDGFGHNPHYSFLVAIKNQEIIGLSFYFIRYSTWKGKFLYLEDFVIKKDHRNIGVGSLLFKETIKICCELNLNGMSWQVLEWNTPAINFYKKHNAQIGNKWLNGKLTKNQIKKSNLKQKKGSKS